MTDAQIERVTEYLNFGFHVYWSAADGLRRIKVVRMCEEDGVSEIGGVLDRGYVALEPLGIEDIVVFPPYTPVWPDNDKAASHQWMTRVGLLD